MIIILNGSINSGKTTVAKILRNKIPNTAFIEVDKLREFVERMPQDKAFPLSIENAVLVMKNFVKKGLNVIFTYPLSEDNYKSIINKLQDVYPSYAGLSRLAGSKQLICLPAGREGVYTRANSFASGINTKIYTFTFNPDLNKALTNRGTRKLTNWEMERIKYHYDIGINKPSFGKIIDNTNQTPEETANEILGYIEKNR